MESAALVSGEYSSSDENTEKKEKGIPCDVNYEEVGMDMGSSSASETEDDRHDGVKTNSKGREDESLFSSKEDYEAYQNQFKDNPEEQKLVDEEEKSEYGESTNKNCKTNNHTEYGESNERDEYGRCQPSKNKNPKRIKSPEVPQSSPREPHRRNNQFQRNENEDTTSREETKQKQPNKRPSLSDEKLQDKLLMMSQEEPSSSGSERGGSRKQHTSSNTSRSRSQDKSRKSSSPKSTSRRRSRSHERKREHDRHRSSHHRSSKHHHHHRDHRDRDRERHDGRDRNYRGNDGRRNRDRMSEEHRQELRNKKLVNLGITSNAVLAAASQAGGFECGSSDAVAMRAQLMISKQLEAQIAKAKEVTGVELPSYYNPSVINPLRYADQIKKRKLLWGSSGGGTGVRQPGNPVQEALVAQGEPNSLVSGTSHSETMQARKNIFETAPKQPEKESFNNWESSSLGDDKATDKFRRLMGIKSGSSASDAGNKNPSAAPAPGDKTAKFFQEQEAQYERARAITHTQRGKGFGFSDVLQQPDNPTTSYSLQGNVSDKPIIESNSSNPPRGIGEKLGFVKKSF